jgi:hypothetical protein
MAANEKSSYIHFFPVSFAGRVKLILERLWPENVVLDICWKKQHV